MGVKKKADEAFFVYLGPSIQGVIQNATVFHGSREQVEKSLDASIQRYPRIKALLIGSDTLCADRINIKKPGSWLYEEYRLFIRELNKGGKPHA